jgi:hypothetical protein
MPISSPRRRTSWPQALRRGFNRPRLNRPRLNRPRLNRPRLIRPSLNRPLSARLPVPIARDALSARGWRALALGAFAVVSVVLIVLSRQGAAANGGDLCRDYISAAQLLHGHDPYAPSDACGVLRYSPHPPLALLLLVPLAWLSVGTVALVWDLLMLAALIAALWIIWDEALADLAPRWAALGLAALAFWPPLLDTWLEAQISPLVLLLLALAWRARRHGQPGAAGAWLALAALIRLYPILLFIDPLVRREWRVAVGGVIAGLGVTLLTLPIIGPAEYLRYITRAAPGASADWINDAHNVSLRGWLGQLFVGGNTIHPVLSAPEIVTPLYALGALALVGLLVWQRSWLLGIPVMLVISPLAWPHYFIVLLLPWLVLAGQLIAAKEWNATAWMLLAAVALLYLNALGLRLLLPLPRRLAWPAAVFVFALPFYTLVLSVLTLWRSPKRRSGYHHQPNVLSEN